MEFVLPNKKLSSTHEVDHALQADLEFKALARRNKLLGYWLADMMGKSESEAEEYAMEVVRADLEEPGDEDVVRKVMADVNENGLPVTEDKLREEIEHYLHVARGQIEDESQA
jgi:hypothetical protein